MSLVYVGTYARNGGAGLYPLSRSTSGRWLVGTPYEDAQNASFGTHSRRHEITYLLDEQPHGALGAYRAAPDGWRQVARLATRGDDPCYIALNADETLLAVANYGSGSIALYRIDRATGLPIEPPAIEQHDGSGPNQERQEGPHAHCVCFRADRLYVADLGSDHIFAYAVDPVRGTLGKREIAFTGFAGSGPRHLVFHPTLPRALVVSEMASTLTQLRIVEGQLIAEQTISTLPDAFAGDNLAGHLALNGAGDRVYVTNRGHDSIAVFAWANDGMVKLRQHVSSGGASPRAFVLLSEEAELLVANEEAGTVSVFDVSDDGRLSQVKTCISVPGAAFLLESPT
ncbi:MAG: lactonase family protein [Pseudomonas sp.]|uniref:lactonase family protein n=1 Tax=Pseudomonas sp. TaxID=306 RepID=UPI0012019D1C|nr:lactonase family protein [Pseudomonas sp.]RZI76966.1 MAG: lactonase family protein [Pseudomonas sp.]